SDRKSLAAEVGRRGIRVNCVAPGWVETDMTRQALSDAGSRRTIEQGIPIGRVAQPADIAGPVVFLVSDLARHVQGEVLNVNGGSVLSGWFFVFCLGFVVGPFEREGL